MITEQQAEALCKLIIEAIPTGHMDNSTQKMLLIAIKTIKGAVANEQSDIRSDQH